MSTYFSSLPSTLPPKQSKPTILSVRLYSWLDHAESHFREGYIYHNDTIIPVDEQLMYLCLMSYVGMFD